MSGLQASISTHIAKEYYYPDGKWGTNLPLFVKAVGSHPDRMSNLYFTFLFVLRAVVKAGDTLTDYPYHTGKKEDDEMVRTLIRRLVKARQPSLYPKGFTSIAREKTAKALKAILELSEEGKKNGKDAGSKNKTEGKFSDELEQCRTGFDESVLFQASHYEYLIQLSHGDFSSRIFLSPLYLFLPTFVGLFSSSLFLSIVPLGSNPLVRYRFPLHPGYFGETAATRGVQKSISEHNSYHGLRHM